eukprot:COSAG06_NODE_36347_length_448_cov_0.862464_1_plen_112_part_10
MYLEGGSGAVVTVSECTFRNNSATVRHASRLPPASAKPLRAAAERVMPVAVPSSLPKRPTHLLPLPRHCLSWVRRALVVPSPRSSGAVPRMPRSVWRNPVTGRCSRSARASS